MIHAIYDHYAEHVALPTPLYELMSCAIYQEDHAGDGAQAGKMCQARIRWVCAP